MCTYTIQILTHLQHKTPCCLPSLAQRSGSVQLTRPAPPACRRHAPALRLQALLARSLPRPLGPSARLCWWLQNFVQGTARLTEATGMVMQTISAQHAAYCELLIGGWVGEPIGGWVGGGVGQSVGGWGAGTRRSPPAIEGGVVGHRWECSSAQAAGVDAAHAVWTARACSTRLSLHFSCSKSPPWPVVTQPNPLTSPCAAIFYALTFPVQRPKMLVLAWPYFPQLQVGWVGGRGWTGVDGRGGVEAERRRGEQLCLRACTRSCLRLGPATSPKLNACFPCVDAFAAILPAPHCS